ncbi:16S rRNA m(5)C-967 methyltransferase [Tamilnaduibacter salinus]|uniref:16S rRNA (cytosine(967)-C(5))-methyltransferase n=1 Tax=Tamilnaduibacter salinus TaxID=1484056 RepID=A0A2U1CY97_9GAMM|nr:16S rRNA (cytosine(967)-C(5))-methyltransferase RsmB [Tamilnaduibacter salinus]PVY77453.1 16S rRNA m(5)C-967 methyltransferase [Tamilnaduibacter salinus]
MAARTQPLRVVAAEVVTAVLDGQSLGQALPSGQQRVAPSDQSALQALSFGSCRWYHRLNAELTRRLRKPLRRKDQVIQSLLIVALFQLRHSHQADHAIINETVEACRSLGRRQLAGLVNGVLRAAQRDGEPAPDAPDERLSHPLWMTDKLRHNWPEDWESLLTANNQPPPMTLRVNAKRTDREAYLEELAQADIPARATPFAPYGIQLDQPCPVDRLPGFNNGRASVQDEAAQLCTTLLDLQPGQRVLDACAAPGGKTGAILEQGPDDLSVTALDDSADRLPRIRENLDRLGLSARLAVADAGATDQWWDGQPFDRILLDAPCSGSGVIRRHPDIKLLRREDDIKALAEEQLRLLSALWDTLAVGGRLVYATCSVFPQENHRIIQRFLRQQPQARLVPIDAPWGRDTGDGHQLFPGDGSHDGFFYACLVRSDSNHNQAVTS